MGTASPTKEKKVLSLAQGVQAACILFALNTEHAGIIKLAMAAGMDDVLQDQHLQAQLIEEWHAFVHATVTTGLMQHAPNAAVVEYLRQTKAMLQASMHFDAARAERFVDESFAVYMDTLATEKQKQCPALFFQRLLHKNLHELPEKTCALIASTMAMTIATISDTLEGYDIATA
jgi:hypothetical protein